MIFLILFKNIVPVYMMLVQSLADLFLFNIFSVEYERGQKKQTENKLPIVNVLEFTG